jgi:hypothetical protein
MNLHRHTQSTTSHVTMFPKLLDLVLMARLHKLDMCCCDLPSIQYWCMEMLGARET